MAERRSLPEGRLLRLIERRRRLRGEEAGLPLTARQREILHLLAVDVPPKRIAQRLCLSYETVTNHLHHAYLRLGVHSAAGAVAAAWRLGVLDGAPTPLDPLTAAKAAAWDALVAGLARDATAVRVAAVVGGLAAVEDGWDGGEG